jgi:hypothetical protein
LKAVFQSKRVKDLENYFKKSKQSNESLVSRILAGGYPEPSLSKKLAVRTRWFGSYRKTYIERDIQEVSAIERLPDFNRLMALAAARTGQVLNFSELGRDLGLPYITLRRYMNILEQTYQVFLVPPFFVNVSKRLMKAPKLYWTDTGLATYLLDIHDTSQLQRNPKLGAIFETWVAAELKKLISLEPEPMNLYGWRTQTGQEVDFLIEKGGQFLALEVKWGQHVDKSIFKSFKTLKDSLGDNLILSLVLYGGKEITLLGDKLLAVPHEFFFGGVS